MQQWVVAFNNKQLINGRRKMPYGNPDRKV
jgi:hypothetical protein